MPRWLLAILVIIALAAGVTSGPSKPESVSLTSNTSSAANTLGDSPYALASVHPGQCLTVNYAPYAICEYDGEINPKGFITDMMEE
ncbi:hypothetical protein KIPB_010485, partial [Kipferlia bialata]|eukprot:g10485.t1